MTFLNKTYIRPANLGRWLKFDAFRKSTRGLAAIEFALVFPLLLTLYVYTIEFSRAFDEKRKVDRLASTIADIISQQSTGKPIPVSVVSSLMSASGPLVSPFATQSLGTTASVINLAVRADGTCCDARTRWSYTRGGTLRPCGSLLQQVPDNTPPSPDRILASAIGVTSGSPIPGDIVITDVHDGFDPIFKGLFIFFTSGFSRTVYLSARSSGQLSLQTPFAAKAGEQGQVC